MSSDLWRGGLVERDEGVAGAAEVGAGTPPARASSASVGVTLLKLTIWGVPDHCFIVYGFWGVVVIL